MGLENLGKREDLKIGETLPNTSASAWVHSTLSAAAPHIRLPQTLPALPGGMLRTMMRLSVAASNFPLSDPRRLAAELKRAVLSATQQLMPHAVALQATPNPGLMSMTHAARLTLALREKGVCPMALAKVDARYAAGTQARMSAAASIAARLQSATIAPFGLTPAQQGFAAQMALMAKLGSAPQSMGLPPLDNPNFGSALKQMLAALAAMPLSELPVSELIALASKLEALDTIRKAFGDDALTPDGVARVNAMLNHMASLNVPVPVGALALQAKLDGLPKMDDVRLGAQTVRAGATGLVTSLTTPPPSIPLVGTLEALGALGSVMARAMNSSPFGPCRTCTFA